MKSTDLKNSVLFISQHNPPVHRGTCPILSHAPENQQHKIPWAAVGTARDLETQLRAMDHIGLLILRCRVVS
jgi:hypothetical protein